MVSALLVILGGGAGAIARFLLDGTVGASLSSRRQPTVYPLGTLAVNLSGAFLLGLIVGAGTSGHVLTVLGTATLGSYTTFSTWMLETHRPAQDGEVSLAWLNVSLSLLLGLGAIALGRTLGGAL